MDELLNQYVERFGENFPIFCLMGKDEKEVCKIVQQCLDSGNPYELTDDDPTIDY